MEICIIELKKFKDYKEKSNHKSLNSWIEFIESPEVVDMSKSVRGLFSHGMVVVVALLATTVVLAPCAAHATESPEVADRIAESLYVPEGVEGGIKVNDEGLSSGVAPEYGRLETGGGVSELAELPRSYDLREVQGASYVSPVKNQYRWQDCWVFASLGSLESSLLLQGRGDLAANDFSELQLTQARRTLVTADQAARLGAAGQAGEGIVSLATPGTSVHPDNGFLWSPGYIYEASDAMFSGMGPVSEKSAPFRGSGQEGRWVWYHGLHPEGGYQLCVPDGSTSWKLSDPFASDPLLWLGESRLLGTLGIVSESDGVRSYEGVDWEAVSRVKAAIMSDGGVSVGIYSGGNVSSPSFSGYDTEYYNAEHGAQYVDEPISMGHFVTIVGWDDDYPRENFQALENSVPPDDGAWIIKDSYGTYADRLDSGYFSRSGIDGTGFRYVSYYDQSLDYTCQLVAGEDVDSDDVVLQYDLLGTSPYSEALLVDAEASTANVFIADRDMLLEATTASTLTNDSRVTVEVYLLDESDGDPECGELACTTSALYSSPGRYRVELTEPVELREGQRFSIVETVSSEVIDGEASGTKYYLGLECGTTAEYAEELGTSSRWDAVSNTGESWVKMDGAWADAQTLNESDELTANGKVYGNALIKAYGSETGRSQGDEAAVTMWRLYNQWTGEHFYTASDEERAGLIAVGWRDEGLGWYAPASGEEVYRLYNPYVTGGDHHYTLSAGERDELVAAGWEYEGVGWMSAPASTGVPLYRQYNPFAATGTHNYTTSEEERDNLVSVGWRDEGVAWYGVELEHN